ncbi:MAG: L-threonylcarbamoyladenylate synthase [Flaviflexus sp.]|uniref:L-threonylcarbamoyladenylate synthase n=1 Tax=Flaviflexus sp. TaxID=1969482 RepID=UPI003F8E2641
MDIRDCTTDSGALDAASVAVSNGKLIVLPTDTVYGIGADAFNPAAVSNLLDAKGRGRQMPPPVLVGTKETAEALAESLPQAARDLIAEFWPGALTIIVKAQPSLAWDLGETAGTVALRMPDSETALALLQRTGPLAVSSANIHAQPAATTIDEATEMLGQSVALYLDGGKADGGVASTIVDVTSEPARILRQGAIEREKIAALIELEELPGSTTDEPGSASDAASGVTEEAGSTASASAEVVSETADTDSQDPTAP